MFQCPRGLGDFSHLNGHRVVDVSPAVSRRFNAREGLVTFPTSAVGARDGLSRHSSFNAREGLVTFPTDGGNRFSDNLPEGGLVMFQCPRGLGDFSHSPCFRRDRHRN